MIDLPAKGRLIVALDFDSEREALALVESLGDAVDFYKVGWQLFFGTHFHAVQKLAAQGKKIFLDLKMTDIPATIRQAINNAPREAVNSLELMTLSGPSAVVKAARAGAPPHTRLKFLMLTALSSMDDADIKALYGAQATLEKVALHTAEKALDAGCDGLIASGSSVKLLRETFKGMEFIIVTPGIRPEGTPVDDHKRSLTPYRAIVDGADYLVVGRPISGSPRPREMAQRISSDIEKALADR